MGNPGSEVSKSLFSEYSFKRISFTRAGLIAIRGKALPTQLGLDPEYLSIASRLMDPVSGSAVNGCASETLRVNSPPPEAE